ncbi:MAG: hypothetical protein PHE51_03515 [Eubacteriales bacterium]|nr:hypothetical protein [Eubacteriales bacterium]
MALRIEEQELCINAMRDEEFATAYCSDSMWITKFDKLVEKSPDLFEVVFETDWGKTYKFPKRLISIRSCIVTREMSEEQRQLASDRMKEMRKGNSKS